MQKKNDQRRRKLSLRRESLRKLQPAHLARVNGGFPITIHAPTEAYCGTGDCE